MTGTARFELASSSPEGSTFAPTYPNGQRGSYGGGSLDRSGSFRESNENRARTSGSGTSRGGAIMMEMPPLSQALMLDLLSLGDQKFSCLGELRKILGTSPRITSGDHAAGATLTKPLPPVVSEELKRVKTSLQESSARARDRAKMLGESLAKLDKFRHNVLSKKRQRNDAVPGERASLPALSKTGSQVHQNSSDLVAQRLEDRTKTAVPNRRVRTSVAEVRYEGRNAAFSRQGMGVDKDRDMLRAGNGGSMQAEDKARGLPPGGDGGWDKKMKRKRSVGTVGTRTIDGDMELKQRMQQRLNSDSISRPSDGERELKRFRSGYSNGIIGTTKSDGSPLTNSSSARNMPRNDVDSMPLPNRSIGLDKERTTSKGGNKLNLREDGQAGSPGAVTKGKASRAPRPGPGVVASPSNFPRTSSNLDGLEQPTCSNKFQSTTTLNNRKRPLPTESPLPSVAQWAGQRPPKNSRTKRMNIVSPISNQEEPQVSPEGFPAADVGARSTSTEPNGPILSKGVSSDSLQFKTKLENAQSPAGLLSESEESGAGENKPRVKGVENGEIEDGPMNGNALQKVTAFSLPKKNKMPIKDELGDCVRRQGRSGRVTTPSRPSTPLTGDKLENAVLGKPIRGTKPGSDKIESKSGRPPTKKFAERKGIGRPGKVVNPGTLDFTGESDDDHDELLSAASSARNANRNFSIYSSVQISFAEELDENLSDVFSAEQSVMVECACEPATLSSGERQGNQQNGIGLNACTRGSVNGPQDCDKPHRRLETEKWFEKIIPLSQRLLQAFIVEDESEEFYLNGERRDTCFQYSSDDSPCGPYSLLDNEVNGDRTASKIESEVDIRSNHHNMDKFSCNGSAASNNFMSGNSCDLSYNNEAWQEDDTLGHSEIGQNNMNGLQPMHKNSSGISTFECQYQQMSLEDRIFAELHSIGLAPDMVPDLTEGEDEDINKDISELQKGLVQQVIRRKKGQLCELEQTVHSGREMEERIPNAVYSFREREKLAMSKLVEIAYKKHTSCRSSNKGGVSKALRQAASAFVVRTLARCQKFEERGRSYFSELGLRDLVFSPPLDSVDSRNLNRNKAVADGSLHVEDGNGRHEFRASGILLGTLLHLVENYLKNSPFGGIRHDNPLFLKRHGMQSWFMRRMIYVLNTKGEVEICSVSRLVALNGAGGAVSCTDDRHGLFTDKLDGLSDAIQDPNNTSEPAFGKLEQTTNRVKRREVHLDSVGLSVSRAASALVNTFPGGAKGKRSERERDMGKDGSTRNLAKSGRPALGNLKGERKTKTKPKQKTAQLPTSGGGLLSRSTETASTASPFVHDSFETATNAGTKVNEELGAQDPSMEMEEPLDFSKLQLPGMDMMEELGAPDGLGGQGQDFGSWFNFDVELQDNDLIGLAIPMDDLSTI
ncbi:hypothetical protein ACLOJK_031344 [Asimina triloba]